LLSEIIGEGQEGKAGGAAMGSAYDMNGFLAAYDKVMAKWPA
jgi:hypothetical protein